MNYKEEVSEIFYQFLDSKDTMLVDEFVKDAVVRYELEDMSEEEIGELFNVLADLTSYSSRMRIKVGDMLAEKVMIRMLDEADEQSGE